MGELANEEVAAKVMDAMKNVEHPLATDFKIKEILMGDFDLDLKDAVMNPKWNKIYPPIY